MRYRGRGLDTEHFFVVLQPSVACARFLFWCECRVCRVKAANATVNMMTLNLMSSDAAITSADDRVNDAIVFDSSFG